MLLPGASNIECSTMGEAFSSANTCPKRMITISRTQAKKQNRFNNIPSF